MSAHPPTYEPDVHQLHGAQGRRTEEQAHDAAHRHDGVQQRLGRSPPIPLDGYVLHGHGELGHALRIVDKIAIAYAGPGNVVSLLSVSVVFAATYPTGLISISTHDGRQRSGAARYWDLVSWTMLAVIAAV